MYPLLSKKWWTGGLIVVAALALLVDGIVQALDVSITITQLLRLLAMVVIGGITFLVGSSYYWAPWRILWRKFPILNKVIFPDLNGVWVGNTKSNWAVIKAMKDAAESSQAIDLASLQDVQLQRDAMAVEVKASLFSVKIFAALSNTGGDSYSLLAKPRWDCESEKLCLTYVYQQSVPEHVATDESAHLGAADLCLELDNMKNLEGHYWTRRSWRQGLNTAGKIELGKVSERREGRLKEYALLEKAKLEATVPV